MRKCCNFKNGDGERLGIEVSCSHVEQLVDELNLSPNIRAAHPPHLPLPNHVHGLVSLDCSPRLDAKGRVVLLELLMLEPKGDSRVLCSLKRMVCGERRQDGSRFRNHA